MALLLGPCIVLVLGATHYFEDRSASGMEQQPGGSNHRQLNGYANLNANNGGAGISLLQMGSSLTKVPVAKKSSLLVSAMGSFAVVGAIALGSTLKSKVVDARYQSKKLVLQELLREDKEASSSEKGKSQGQQKGQGGQKKQKQRGPKKEAGDDPKQPEAAPSGDQSQRKDDEAVTEGDNTVKE